MKCYWCKGLCRCTCVLWDVRWTYQCQWPSAWRLAVAHASDSKNGAAFQGSCRSQIQPSLQSEVEKERLTEKQRISRVCHTECGSFHLFTSPRMSHSLLKTTVFHSSLQILLFSSLCHHLFAVSWCVFVYILIRRLLLTKKRVVAYVFKITPHLLSFLVHSSFFPCCAALWPRYATTWINYTGHDTVILMCARCQHGINHRGAGLKGGTDIREGLAEWHTKNLCMEEHDPVIKSLMGRMQQDELGTIFKFFPTDNVWP